MSFRRIRSVLLQEFFITYRSVEIIFDVFIFSFISLFLFGFLSLYLVGTRNTFAAKYLLLGMLLWDIIRIIQYSISIANLWNLWARNLCNMFMSPLRVSESLFGTYLIRNRQGNFSICIRFCNSNSNISFQYLSSGIFKSINFLR